MKTYRMSVNVTPAPTSTPDDVLSIVVGAVNALTIVEESGARPVGGGIVNVRATFLGLNDNEARATVQAAWDALRTGNGGAVLGDRPGRAARRQAVRGRLRVFRCALTGHAPALAAWVTAGPLILRPCGRCPAYLVTSPLDRRTAP